MGRTLTQKILDGHLVEGDPRPGQEVGIRLDQVLLQDATGSMAFLGFEAIGFDRVQPRVVVQYLDHHVFQFDSRHTDDHRYLGTAARRYGAFTSKPGNGICHQVHLENFAVPGETLLGSDSHTPHCGVAAMLAIGAGGLDVAVAMGGGPYYFPMPEVVQVRLAGRLRPWSSAKDVILELLRRLTVKGGVGKILEFTGPGIETLDLPERATIANMCTELGTTSALFPSDAVTRRFFQRVGREADWRELLPDPDAAYDGRLDLNLDAVEPLVALPSMPDNVVPVKDVEGTKIDQVMVGSCTNGAYEDLAVVAEILRGHQVHPDVQCVIFPASLRALEALALNGLVAELAAAGAIVSEATCGACPGFGHVPATGSKSLRAFNRNFNGRSGLKNDQVYLCSPEVAAVSALRGAITDPRTFGDPPRVRTLERLPAGRAGLIPPAKPGEPAEVIKGPNIKEVPLGRPLADPLRGEVLIKVGDKISTDDILPSGAESLGFRSNVPAIAEFAFRNLDRTFVERARATGDGIIVGGQHYGQGSSREHAAIVPMYLGVRAVIAKSFARIHRANLINWGILPLGFAKPEDYERILQGQILEIGDVHASLDRGAPLIGRNLSTGDRIELHFSLTAREVKILKAGGKLALTKAGRTG